LGGRYRSSLRRVDLYIIRHGRPVRQVVKEEGGVADPELAEIGLVQAERVADLLEPFGIDHIVSSTMLRARQTAAPLASRLGMEVEIVDDIKESDHRSHAYVPSEEIRADDPDTAHYFEGDLMDTIFSDGYDGFEERVRRGFDHIISTNQSKRVAVFCHGMVTNVFVKTILEFENLFALLPDYCGVTRVRASSDGTRTVKSMNETYHVRDLIDW